MKKYILPLGMLLIFEAVAVTLWLLKDNLFYLFNFSYIGVSISLGICPVPCDYSSHESTGYQKPLPPVRYSKKRKI